jgi:hypothetical protein
VRATITALAASDTRATAISDEDLELLRADDTHYGAEAQYDVGYRLADALIALESDEGEAATSDEDSPSGSATFVVEDGSGLTTSNSYCSVADADDFHEHQGNPSDWGNATSLVKQDALRRATAQLDWLFGQESWAGQRGTSEQALDWPRNYATDAAGYYFDAGEIPDKLAQLTAYGALLLIQGTDISPTVVTTAGIKSESNEVGAISRSITYHGSKPATPELRRLERMATSAGLVVGYGGGWGAATL